MKRKKYVVLEYLRLPDKGLRFWTTNSDNNTHGYNGELWYKEILFTDKEKKAIEESKIIGELPSNEEIKSYYKNLYDNR